MTRREPRTVDYDQVAHAFDARYSRDEYAGVERALRDFAEDARDVLEVGCGTGHWLEVLRRPGRSVTGLDPSGEMLAKAAQRVPEAVLTLGRAESLPWSEATFDRVFMINAFHHVAAPRAALREARRVLRDDGAVLIVGLDPHAGLDRWWIYDVFDGALERDRARYVATPVLRQRLSEAGFRRASTSVAQHLSARLTVRAAMQMGYLESSSTSQLALLDDEEYRRGREALERDLEAVLESDLRLWATVAWAS